MKNLLKNFLGFLGGGGGGGVVEAGGGVAFTSEGVGGIRGTLWAGIVDVEVGVAGVGVFSFALKEVATGPTGSGSFVLELAEPGRTIGLESEMLGLPAYPLCSW